MFDKIIKYQFIDKEYNEKYIAEELIKEIIVKATPSSSCWWSRLKSRTDDAIDILDGKRKKLEDLVKGGDGEEFGATAKTCSGILNLFKKAYLIKSPTDIVITVDSDENYRWETSNEALTYISHHPKGQFWSEGNNLFENKLCFKVELGVRLSMNGFGYMLIEPFYHNNLDARLALGYVNDTYSKSESLNLFVFIDIPKEGVKTLVIPKGDVLQYLIPDVKSKLVFEKNHFVGNLLDTSFTKKRRP